MLQLITGVIAEKAKWVMGLHLGMDWLRRGINCDLAGLTGML
jgi:hypothetical protein